MDLTKQEKELLYFEEQTTGLTTGQKEHAVRERFDISLFRYHARVQRVIDRPEAMILAPVLVQKLLRRRERRAMN